MRLGTEFMPSAEQDTGHKMSSVGACGIYFVLHTNQTSFIFSLQNRRKSEMKFTLFLGFARGKTEEAKRKNSIKNIYKKIGKVLLIQIQKFFNTF